MKTICFFGIYDPTYSRNAVLIEGFEKHGFKIVHCRVNPKEHHGIKKYFMLIRERMKVKNPSFILVAFPGHTCALLARILFPRTLVVFDVFLSLYEANVGDRKVHSGKSLKGYRDRFLDWHSIRCADIVTLDTFVHINVFKERYGLDPTKARRILIGCNVEPKNYAPMKFPGQFIVHFHGSFIPLHGVEYILGAAKILQSDPTIHFRLIGGGQAQSKMVEKAKEMKLSNVTFTGRLPEFSSVMEEMAGSQISLGTFGTSVRAEWVIMNKTMESAAFGMPIITQDTPAMREVFTDSVDVLLCKTADFAALAEKILKLKNDSVLRQRLGTNVRTLYEKMLTPEIVVKDFLDSIQPLI